MKFRHHLRHAPKTPDMGAAYKARICNVRFVGSNVVCDWTIYTPKNRKKKTKTVSKQSGKGG